MTRFISNQFIAEAGATAFLDVLMRAPTKVRSTVVDVFTYDPIDGIRCALAYKVYKSFLGKDAPLEYTTSEAEIVNDNLCITFNFSDGKKISSNWIEEQGSWKLQDFDGFAAEKNAKKSVKKTTKKSSEKAIEDSSDEKTSGQVNITIEDPYFGGITGGINLSMNDLPSGWYGQLTFGFNIFNIVMFVDSRNLLKYPGTSDEFSKDKLAVGSGIRLQLPVNFNKVIVEPFGEGKVGIAGLFDADMSESIPFCFSISGGVDLIICGSSENFAFVIDAKYSKFFYEDGEDGRFEIGGGIKFNLF